MSKRRFDVDVINVGETARAVFHYIRDQEQRDLDRIEDSERDFERYAQQFERLAENEEEEGRQELMAIGSGDNFALSAARALMTHTAMPAAEIAREAMKIAGDICDIDQISHHRFDIAPDVADLGELAGFHLEKGGLGQLGEPPGDFGLADAGGADH